MSRTTTTPIQHLARCLLCFGIITIELFCFNVSSVNHNVFQPQARSASAHARLASHYADGADGIYWPQGQALPIFASPDELDVARVTNQPGDLCLLLATLQGLVNRSRPQIYLEEGEPAEGPAPGCKASMYPIRCIPIPGRWLINILRQRVA
ncbi:GxGYxYP domain-containing protein [Dictyobacter kobayashii]|uniref:GxGYxYP putative glycoside hydrolase first N-terminal domain-containing protein n=1 Tax=Dictyobacter kobayashii TaxID=2014872 RepID=A0A402ARH8_9CHLR|nr:GxGYxYP domain-containing protein [Dictyobacter kobayashii]GCE21716.1 hypothetical protein KDK_55160 [Dictyobacter kobayashii]